MQHVFFTCSCFVLFSEFIQSLVRTLSRKEKHSDFRLYLKIYKSRWKRISRLEALIMMEILSSWPTQMCSFQATTCETLSLK